MTTPCVMCSHPIPERTRGVTCSYVCRARFRESRKTTEWRVPREYPPEVVERVRSLYQDHGLTIAEIRPLVPGYKVQLLMTRHGISRRPTAKRDQSGERNSSWRGDAATYSALHLRVAERRGKPSLCEWCGATEGRFEWANLTGNYADVDDYERLCVSCHRHYDAARRRATGERTSPARRSA